MPCFFLLMCVSFDKHSLSDTKDFRTFTVVKKYSVRGLFRKVKVKDKAEIRTINLTVIYFEKMEKEVLINIILNDISELKAISEELKKENPTAAIEIDIALSKSVLLAQQFQLLKEKMGVKAFRSEVSVAAAPVVAAVTLPDVAALTPEPEAEEEQLEEETEEEEIAEEEDQDDFSEEDTDEQEEAFIENPAPTVEFEIESPVVSDEEDEEIEDDEEEETEVESEEEIEDEDADVTAEEETDEEEEAEEEFESEVEESIEDEEIEEEEEEFVDEESEEDEEEMESEEEDEMEETEEENIEGDEEVEESIEDEEVEEEETEEEETIEEEEETEPEAAEEETVEEEEDESESEEEPHQKTVGEAFHQEKSVNDTASKQSTLDQKIANGPINSLQASIGVNDRFLFIREVFNNDADLYNTAVETIDRCNDIREAADYLSANFRIKRTDASLKFVDLIKRRFTK